MRRELLRIGGALREGAGVDVITSPYSGEPVGEVARAGARDMDDAIAAAAAAFEVTRRLPTHRRAAILEGAARAVEARKDELARLMALEGGKPITLGLAEVTRVVVTLSLGAQEARRIGGPRRAARWSRSPRSTSR